MDELPSYTILRTPEPIRIDGRLDEPVWSRLPSVGPFTLVLGAGRPALPTELKLCWDDTYLYLGFVCIDTDIWGTYRNHDDPVWEEEVAETFLCSGGDITQYFEFNFSPHNVVFDAKIHIPEDGDRAFMQAEPEWVCQGLQSAVEVFGTLDDHSTVDEKWVVEAALPFAEIGRGGRAPVEGEEWRGNFFRIDRAGAGEFSCWSPTLAPNFHVPARFGHLVFSTAEC
jgi:hypothetical protein